MRVWSSTIRMMESMCHTVIGIHMRWVGLSPRCHHWLAPHLAVGVVSDVSANLKAGQHLILTWRNSVPHHTQPIKEGYDGFSEVYIL